MRFLFEFVDSDGADPFLKGNILISLGDMFNRFTIVLDPFSGDLFRTLRAKEPYVRKTALRVISHLVLNDMLKLKGEISEICRLLEDTDDGIRQLVKLFLHELHTKNSNIIYNLIPQAINKISEEGEHTFKASKKSQAVVLPE